MNSNSKKLVITYGLHAVLTNFISIFLGMYFLKVTGGNITTVAKYYIVDYLCHILFFFVIYKFFRKIKDIHIYRTSLIVTLAMCALLLVMKENVVNYIYLIAVIHGLAQSLYYTVYKTMITDIVDDNSYNKYFSYTKASESIVGLVCGIAFAEIISYVGFSAVFVILTITTFIAIIVSFTIKYKVKKKRVAEFNIPKFIKHTSNRHALYRLWTSAFCYGLGQGGLLAVLVSLVISIRGDGNRTLGYLSSAVALFSILYSFIHKKYIDESNFKFRLLPASIILFVISIPLALTGNLLSIVAYRFIAEALTVSTLVERNRTTYCLIPTITTNRYRKEYFYSIEVILNISRIVSMLSIILVMNLTNNAENLTYLFMLGTVGFFVMIIIIDGLYKYCHIGKCKEAIEEEKEQVKLEECTCSCNSAKE